MSKSLARRSAAQRKTPANRLHPESGQPALSLSSLVDFAIGLGLILSVFAVYAQTGAYDFIAFDDNDYVYKNPHLAGGLSLENLKYAFTSVVSANWAPLTVISHLLAGQLFHLQSGMHHLINVLFHAMSSVLLFVLLHRATRARWASAFVAFMFALHPLHVESVAWIAERKDVLSAFFCFLALYAYVRYTERPGVGRYLLTAVFFSLGLLSKSMLVTFPFMLLLLDFWPLRRWQWPKVLWEKLPLLLLSAASAAMTYWAQQSGGAVKPVPIAAHIENVLISYVTYLGQTLWPARLAVFYPFSKSMSAWQAVLASAVIVGVSALAIVTWRTRPYLAVGWFWYVGTLVPVIGIVQVGVQSHADRYTYIPMIGLSLMLAWGAADLIGKWPQARLPIAAAAIVCCMVWMTVSSRQVTYWKNSEVLFRHALEVTEDNWMVEYQLADLLKSVPGRRNEAIAHYEESVRIRPDYGETQMNLGLMLVTVPGRQAEALAHLQAAQSMHHMKDLEGIISALSGGKK